MKIKERITCFLSSLIITILLIRLYLFIFPNTNFAIGSYGVHHIFIGSVLLIIAVILLMFNISNCSTYILGGISTALIIDQIIFLIVTDGSDKNYLSRTSLYGALVLTFVIILTVLVLYFSKEKKR